MILQPESALHAAITFECFGPFKAKFIPIGWQVECFGPYKSKVHFDWLAG